VLPVPPSDAVITPAISVLSAVEGLKLVAPHMEGVVVPITLIILVLCLRFKLAALQNTARSQREMGV
jgi:K+ transporter